MTTGTINNQARPVNQQAIPIEENSAFLKAVSCIPLIGMWPSALAERSLNTKLQNETSAPRLIELIQVKNDYKKANGIRNLLSLALVIGGLALGIMSKGVAVFSGIFFAGIAAFNAHRATRNVEVIQELQSSGFRPGMTVV